MFAKVYLLKELLLQAFDTNTFVSNLEPIWQIKFRQMNSLAQCFWFVFFGKGASLTRKTRISGRTKETLIILFNCQMA
jgi:hypothetical protein